ncbi:MAG: HAD-IA family hydrolase [Dehalococcoidales bacterium]|nr:HAD-IA family hydrolase [Dehalococcoidales bacterium]
MKYKVIIFDLFGTLVKNVLSSEYREMLVEITDILSVEQDEFINLWLENSDDHMTGRINNADCLSLVCRKIGIEMKEELSGKCLEVFTDHVRLKLEPPASTLTTLSDLRERGYDIGLISNCSDEVSLLWNDSPLSSLIKDPVFSCSVGMKKPDIDIYLLAADKMRISPGECLFVDDSVEYLRGARQAGMTGVLIQDRTLNSSFSNPEDWDGYAINSIREMETLLNNLE